MSAPTFYWLADIVYGVVAILIGALAFGLGPRYRENRLLFWVLLVEGLAVGAYGVVHGWNFGHLDLPFEVVWAAHVVAACGFMAVTSLYLVFVAHVAPVSWNRWLRKRIAVALGFLAALGVGLVAIVGVHQAAALGFEPAWWVWFSRTVQLLVYGSSLVMAIAFLRAGPVGSTVRRHAKWVMAAVLARDIPWFLEITRAFVMALTDSLDDAQLSQWLETVWIPFLAAFAVVATLGVLRGQLVDVDRKLHLTISRTSLAAIFIAVFIGIQTAVSEFAAETLGWVAAGIATAALVFVMAPLQRLAERLADRAVPRGSIGHKMSQPDREDFFREQVEIAYSDGAVGAKERRALRSVRERLGLSEKVALSIEDAVVG